MARHRITCIVKPDRNSPHEHITWVGSSDEGLAWTREDAIKMLENKTDTFYVRTGTHTAEVSVYYPTDGRRPFLRTHSDGYWNDNLLSLEQCILK